MQCKSAARHLEADAEGEGERDDDDDPRHAGQQQPAQPDAAGARLRLVGCNKEGCRVSKLFPGNVKAGEFKFESPSSNFVACGLKWQWIN